MTPPTTIIREQQGRSQIADELQTARDGRRGDGPKPRRRRLSSGTRLIQLSMFARQLFVLTSCGTPLVEALRALQRQSSNQIWRTVLEEVTTDVERGSSLADAMEAHPDCFDAVTRTLVAAGETAGNLETMLDRVASVTTQRLTMRRAILGSLTYPALLLSVASGALLVLMFLVIPRFSEMFASLDAPLPPTTQLIVSLSELLRGFWWAMLPAVIGAIIGLVALTRQPAGRALVDQTILQVPKIGDIARNFATARIVRLLGVLTDARVPLIDAIVLTRGAMSNTRYQQLLDDAAQAVGEGDPLSRSFDDPTLIAPAVYEAIHSGEQAGQLGPLLLNMAEFLDDDNQTTARALTTILEPFILIILGLMIGFVAISMFMPLFDLTAMAKGG